MIYLSDLTREVTADEAKSTLYAVCTALGLPTTGWLSGAVVRTIIAVVAVVVAGISRVIVQIAKGRYRTLAEGDWLTLLAQDEYGIERIGAEFATGTVRLTKTGGAVYELEPGDVILKHKTLEVFYTNRDHISLVGNTPVDAVFVAREAGTGSNASVGDITILTTTLLGVTVTNTTVFRGRDGESDAELRARCASVFASLSPAGPADAYLYTAKKARLNGILIGVDRVLVRRLASSYVQVVLAKSTGELDASELAQVTTDIQSVTPLGVDSSAISATALPTNVRYTAYAYPSNQSAADIKTKIEAALRAWIQSRPIGGDKGYLWADVIRSVVLNADPSIYHVALTAPAADIVMDATSVAIPGDITSNCEVLFQ